MQQGSTPIVAERRRATVVTIGALALGAGIFLVDLLLPLGVPISSLYIVPVLMALWVPDPRLGVWLAAMASALALLAIPLSPPGGVLSFGVVNRVLSIAIVWTTAVLVVLQRRTIAAVEERTRQAQQYLDVAEVMLVALDRAGRVSLINRKGCEVLGAAEGDIVGSAWFDRFVPARVAPALRERFERLLSGGTPGDHPAEHAVVRTDGRERLIAWHTAVLHDSGGECVGVLSSGVDITERRQTEEALGRSLKELSDFKYALDHAAILAATDTSGKITYVNDKFCEISKYSREELLGQDHRMVNSNLHSKEFIRDLWVTIAHGGIWRGEIRNRAKDGTYYWVDTTIVPFLNERKQPTQYLAIRYDITERKRTEALLREQETLARMGEMAAVVAHEVKNPLAGIRGALQIIGARMAEDSRDRRVVGEIINRLDALNAMIQDLLLFARPREPKLAPVSLRTLIEATAGLMKRDPAAAGVEVRVEGEAPLLMADAEMMKAVFLNLLLNAGQAMEGRGGIDVTIGANNGRCTVSVRDAGPGIPPDVRERMFQPFFTTKHRGSGLGLSIARRVVELHRGAIEVDCPPEGGTVLTVTLPASTSPA